MDSKELMGQPTTIASGMYFIKGISFYWFRRGLKGLRVTNQGCDTKFGKKRRKWLWQDFQESFRGQLLSMHSLCFIIGRWELSDWLVVSIGISMVCDMLSDMMVQYFLRNREVLYLKLFWYWLICCQPNCKTCILGLVCYC